MKIYLILFKIFSISSVYYDDPPLGVIPIFKLDPKSKISAFLSPFNVNLLQLKLHYSLKSAYICINSNIVIFILLFI